MQRTGNRVGVDDGMRSIVVRKRASNEDWLAHPNPYRATWPVLTPSRWICYLTG